MRQPDFKREYRRLPPRPDHVRGEERPADRLVEKAGGILVGHLHGHPVHLRMHVRADGEVTWVPAQRRRGRADRPP